jgi:hypothetical protein
MNIRTEFARVFHWERFKENPDSYLTFRWGAAMVKAHWTDLKMKTGKVKSKAMDFDHIAWGLHFAKTDSCRMNRLA